MLLAQKLLYLLECALGILQVVAGALHIAVLQRGASFLQDIIEPDGRGFDVAAEAKALRLDSLFDGPHTSLGRGRANGYAVDTVAQLFQFWGCRSG